MVIYLIQHGEALPEEVDAARPLSPEGRKNAENVARVAKSLGLSIPAIYHSGKLRALQTAEIFAAFLESRVEERAGLAPNDPAVPVAQWLYALEEQGGNSVALSGHLPFMDRLASFLVTGDENASVVAFRYAALVRLVPKPAGEGYRVEWILSPEFAGLPSGAGT